VRSHHKSDQPRVYGTHERTKHDNDNSNLRAAPVSTNPAAGDGYAHERSAPTRSSHTHGNDVNEARAGEGRSMTHDVLIIGAGVAGLSAAHELEKHGWTNYKILEASDHIGGRIRQEWSFGENDEEYNIDLGAQFIHTKQPGGGAGEYPHAYDLLQEMVSDPLEDNFKSTYTGADAYTKQEPARVYMSDGNWDTYHEPPEYRWADDMGWHTFVTEYVAYDEVKAKVTNGCAVNQISTGGDGVSVTCADGSTHTAWWVIVTIPMKQLQKNAIAFSPDLPGNYRTAINSFIIGNAFKIWIEYQDQAEFKDLFTHKNDFAMFQTSWDVTTANAAQAGYRLFWNEQFPYGTGFDTKIVGGLIYGKGYDDYAGLTALQVKAKIEQYLNQNGMVTNGVPTGKWTIMDWTKEQFIEGAYTIYGEEAHQRVLQEPTANGKLYFAGEALPVNSWGCVHGAARTGRDQAKKIVDSCS